MRRRTASTAAVVVALALALAGCIPASDGSPGSPGVPMMGQSRVSPQQLASWYRANAPASLPYRASNVSLDDLAALFVSEGNRYNVRGDIAFAQSIVETAWFNFPDYGIVKPWNNNFSGIGACDSCGNGFQFGSPLAGVRAQIQLLRNYADFGSRVSNIPDPPVAELWGSNPATAGYNFDHHFHKGRAPLWNNMGNGNWATAPNYATTVLRVYNQILVASGQPGQCPPDGLLFGSLTGAGPCPPGLRQPGRAVAAATSGGYYVLNGDGTVSAFNGAANHGSPQFGTDAARDIAVMPDDAGYVVLDSTGGVWKYGSAARADTLGPLGAPSSFPFDTARSIAITPDGRGYVVLLADGTVSKWGSAATGPMAALGFPSWGALDYARAVDVMPDGAGYVVLDMVGAVWKYGSASSGQVGAATTPMFSGDAARDIEIVQSSGNPVGYFVLDSWGGLRQGGSLPPLQNPRLTMFADRWRSLTSVNGQVTALKNDGVTVIAVP